MLVNEETAKEIIPRLKKGETTLAGRRWKHIMWRGSAWYDARRSPVGPI